MGKRLDRNNPKQAICSKCGWMMYAHDPDDGDVSCCGCYRTEKHADTKEGLRFRVYKLEAETARLKFKIAELTHCLWGTMPSACFRCEACKDRAICSLDPGVSIVHALGHCQIADGCPIVKVLTPGGDTASIPPCACCDSPSTHTDADGYFRCEEHRLTPDPGGDTAKEAPDA